MSALPLIVGTGSFVCTPLVQNATLFDWLQPRRPDGELVPPEWLERNLGVRQRSFDLDFETGTKRPRDEGGIYDGDLALRAARAALEDAGVAAADVDVFVHVSCTPDTLFFQDHLRYLSTSLGLRRDAHRLHFDLGCAGLAPALRAVRSELAAADHETTVLLVASNSSSSYLTRDTIDFYLRHPHPWAWLSPALFGDGSGALVLRSSGRDRDRGFLDVWYETQPDISIVTYGAGGATSPTSARNLAEHVFIMEPQAVAKSYTPLLRRTFEHMVEQWPVRVEPVVGHGFDIGRIKRWYLHQANRPAVVRTAEELGLPLDRVPTNVECYGNTCSASTLLLLDADRRRGSVEDGDLVAFLWIGAGSGAQYGYAVARV
ncbi:MAG TPA: 3-oxoacyl-[acyl-carrier-protein] synthase III C-terminal domain-containing protein [Vicinamibacteria bacterium]|nr:3-oxoacyl-[acyl-carrier-protein] synthase III C-terminal domain-containing protein [Vicinamibacteria bacterium]